MRHLSPEDQLGDLATPDPKPFPVPVASPPPGVTPAAALTAAGVVPAAAPAKPPKWAREKAPTDAKEAHKWLTAIEEGHEAGVPFYHPGRGQNVVRNADGSITPVSGDVADEEAWYAQGGFGVAPLLKDRPPEKAEKLATKTAPKKGD